MKLLKEKEFPFFFTLVVAGLVWTITHIVDRIYDSSILAYSFSRDEDTSTCMFEFENISRTQIYRDFSIEFYPDQGDTNRIESAEMIFLTNINITNYEPIITRKTCTVIIDRLDPGNSFGVILKLNRNYLPKLFVNPPQVPIRVEKASISSFLLKHEIGILIFMAIFWISLLVFYGIQLKRKKTH